MDRQEEQQHHSLQQRCGHIPQQQQQIKPCVDGPYFENPGPSRTRSAEPEVQQNCSHEQYLPKSFNRVSTGTSKLITMNPFSRSSKLVTVALKNSNVIEQPTDDEFQDDGSDQYKSSENGCGFIERGGDEQEPEEISSCSGQILMQGNENEFEKNVNECLREECFVTKGVENVTCSKNVEERDELDLSTSELIPLTNVNTHDFNPNTSFSEYTSFETNILKTGNTMTKNVKRSCPQALPSAEYLDLNTGQINIRNDCYVESATTNDLTQSDESLAGIMESSQTPNNAIVQLDLEHHSSPLTDTYKVIESPVHQEHNHKTPSPVAENMVVPDDVPSPRQEGEPTGNYEDVRQELETIHREHGTKQKSDESLAGIMESSQTPNNAIVQLDLEHHSSPLTDTYKVIESPVHQEHNHKTPSPVAENMVVPDDVPSPRQEGEPTGNYEDVRQELETIHREHGTKQKRKADLNTWDRKINKRNRESGQEYVGREYLSKDKFCLKTKPAKSMGEKCGCKASFTECNTLTEEDRKAIFKTVWSIGWAEKKQFVSTLTFKKDVSKRTTQDAGSSRRSDTVIYVLKTISGKKARVCKKMLLSTTGLTEHFVRTNTADIKESKSIEDIPKNRSNKEGRLSVLRFLKTLPVMPSHYCRHDTSKLYLEPGFKSDADVIRLYKEYCVQNGFRPACRNVFMNEFEANNYSIYKPRKDQCDDCTKYKEGNMSEEEYNKHVESKDRAREEMEDDVKKAKESGGSIKVITMDLQCVLLCPATKVSALYYRTKLCVHNYTIFDCVSADVKCYVWHEAEGSLSSNEFASCLFRYLSEDSNFNKCVVWSDGCNYQNRNANLSKALTLFAQKTGKVIEQKFLIKGHTQMRVDSVHSRIQQAIGEQPVYCPYDYVRIMEKARKIPKPYEVQYLEHTFFKDFSKTCALKSIRPGTKAGDPTVVDIRALRFDPEGEISFKLGFSDEWKSIPMKRGESTEVTNEPLQIYQARLPIASSKYRHLQELKPYMNADFHAFYDALPHN